MNLPFITHPRTKEADPMLSMACLVVGICGIKFLFEGIDITIMGHVVNLGHADAMTYGAILTPVLGAHATREWRIPANQPNIGSYQPNMRSYDLNNSTTITNAVPIVNPVSLTQPKVDNPDAN